VKYGFGFRFAVLGLLDAAVDVPAYRRAHLAAFFHMMQQAGMVMPPASDAPSTAPSD
jgi:hypothetical protein